MNWGRKLRRLKEREAGGLKHVRSIGIPWTGNPVALGNQFFEKAINAIDKKYKKLMKKKYRSKFAKRQRAKGFVWQHRGAVIPWGQHQAKAYRARKEAAALAAAARAQ